MWLPRQNPQRISTYCRTAYQPNHHMADQRRIMLTHHRLKSAPECSHIGFLCRFIGARIQHRTSMEDKDQNGSWTCRETGWTGRWILVTAIDTVRGAECRTSGAPFGCDALQKRMTEYCVIWKERVRFATPYTQIQHSTSIWMSGRTVIFFGEQLEGTPLSQRCWFTQIYTMKIYPINSEIKKNHVYYQITKSTFTVTFWQRQFKRYRDGKKT